MRGLGKWVDLPGWRAVLKAVLHTAVHDAGARMEDGKRAVQWGVGAFGIIWENLGSFGIIWEIRGYSPLKKRPGGGGAAPWGRKLQARKIQDSEKIQDPRFKMNESAGQMGGLAGLAENRMQCGVRSAEWGGRKTRGGVWGSFHCFRYWRCGGVKVEIFGGFGRLTAGGFDPGDGEWHGRGAAEDCPALAGRREIAGLSPGPPLRSSPGYHIVGLRPFDRARRVSPKESADMSAHSRGAAAVKQPCASASCPPQYTAT